MQPLRGRQTSSSAPALRQYRYPTPWGGSIEPRPLVQVSEGVWSFENLQLGSRKSGQANGFWTRGPGILKLKDVRVLLKSVDGAGIHAHRLGHIYLYGRIELNQDLHHDVGQEKDSWCAIRATDHGTVQFMGSRQAWAR